MIKSSEESKLQFDIMLDCKSKVQVEQFSISVWTSPCPKNILCYALSRPKQIEG